MIRFSVPLEDRYNSRPRHHFDDGHDISLRVEREGVGFKMLERNIPLSHRDTSRNRSQGEEFDRIRPEDPIRVTYEGGLFDSVYVVERRGPFFDRIRGFPPPAVRFESLAAISQGHFRPWVVLQSGTKEVDFVLD